MKRYISNILIGMCSLLLVACQTDIGGDGEQMLVVEGWIEAGRSPMVLLSTTVPITEEKKPMSSLNDNVVRWARVTIDDGEKEAVLIAINSPAYLPPCYYTTTEIEGEVGRTYRIKVDYRGMHAEATTTVPEPVMLDSLRVLPCATSDTLYQVRAYFHDNPNEHNYYKFFVNDDATSRQFMSTYLQCIDDATLVPGQEVEAEVLRGKSTSSFLTYQPYFHLDDDIYVKFVQMDEASYQYWHQMESVSSSVSLTMIGATQNPKSNIIGGLGYWCGYGASNYHVNIADSIAAMKKTGH